MQFHLSSSDSFSLYDSIPASALDKVVTFAGEVLFERFQSSRRRLLANELTCACRTNQEYHMQKTSKRKNTSYFQLKQIDDGCRFDQELCTEKDRTRRTLSCVTSRFRDSCQTKRQLGTVSSFKDRGSCALPKMPKIPQTRRNIWHSRFSIEKLLKGADALENRQNRKNSKRAKDY